MKSGSVFLTVIITVLVGMSMGAYIQFLADQPKIQEAQSRADQEKRNAYEVIGQYEEKWNQSSNEFAIVIIKQDARIKTLTKQNQTLRYLLGKTKEFCWAAINQRDAWHKKYDEVTNPSLRLVNVR